MLCREKTRKASLFFVRISQKCAFWGNVLARELFWYAPEEKVSPRFCFWNHTKEYAATLPEVAAVFVCTSYEETHALLHAWKYNSDEEAGELLISLCIQAAPLLPKIDSIAWVPIGIDRWISRWFNQSKLLAKRFAKKLACQIDGGLVLLWSGQHQSQKTKDQRMLWGESLERRSFYLGSKKKGSVLLIDDVVSTGATARRYVQLLKEAGYEQVYLLASARSESNSPKKEIHL